VMPRGSFDGKVKLTVSGLPEGVSASFNPAITAGSSTLTLTAAKTATPATTTITVSGDAGEASHSATAAVSVTPVLKNTVPVNLSSAYNVTGIYKNGAKFENSASLDAGGYALSEETLGEEQVGDEVVFKLGPPNVADAVTSKTVDLPTDKFASIRILATAVDENQARQIFTVNYTDGTSASFTQTLSDWSGGGNVRGETVAVRVPYRLAGDGSQDSNPFHLFAYSFSLDPTKQVRSVTLPENRNVAVFAITLVPPGM
jgi:alpha-mannosidase